MDTKGKGEITMNIKRTNQYTFTEEEKNIFSKVKIIFDTLSDYLLYSEDDCYELDNLNLTQSDIELIRNALTGLIETPSIVTHYNVTMAD